MHKDARKEAISNSVTRKIYQKFGRLKKTEKNTAWNSIQMYAFIYKNNTKFYFIADTPNKM